MKECLIALWGDAQLICGPFKSFHGVDEKNKIDNWLLWFMQGIFTKIIAISLTHCNGTLDQLSLSYIGHTIIRAVCIVITSTLNWP